MNRTLEGELIVIDKLIEKAEESKTVEEFVPRNEEILARTQGLRALCGDEFSKVEEILQEISRKVNERNDHEKEGHDSRCRTILAGAIASYSLVKNQFHNSFNNMECAEAEVNTGIFRLLFKPKALPPPSPQLPATEPEARP
jgi:hypothetical protein